MTLSRLCVAAGVAMLLLAGPSACDSAGSLGPGADAQALVEASRRWEAAAPASYVFTLFKSCFCPTASPVRVTVRDGVLESAQVIATGMQLTGAELSWVPTIPEVFAALAYAVDLPAATFSARYDPTWGFPVAASIDHWAQTVDDEVGYSLSAFAPLP